MVNCLDRAVVILFELLSSGQGCINRQNGTNPSCEITVSSILEIFQETRKDESADGNSGTEMSFLPFISFTYHKGSIECNQARRNNPHDGKHSQRVKLIHGWEIKALLAFDIHDTGNQQHRKARQDYGIDGISTEKVV